MLIGQKREQFQLICPTCEMPLSEHGPDGCRKKKVSRRFFLGFLGTTLAAAASTKLLPNLEITEAAGDNATPLLVAKQRVYTGESIVVTVSGTSSIDQFKNELTQMALRHGQRTIGIVNKEVVHTYDPFGVKRG